MRTRRTTVAAAAVTLLAAAGSGLMAALPAAAATNLLVNPGFEAAATPTGWTCTGATVNWDQVQGYAFANAVAPQLDRLP